MVWIILVVQTGEPTLAYLGTSIDLMWSPSSAARQLASRDRERAVLVSIVAGPWSMLPPGPRMLCCVTGCEQYVTSSVKQ